MKLTKIKLTTGLSLPLLFLTLSITAKKEPTKQTPQETKIKKNQKLEGPELNILNTILIKKPSVTLKSRSAHDTAQKVVAILEAQESEQKKQTELEKQNNTEAKNIDKKDKNNKDHKNKETDEKELALLSDCKEKLLKPVNKFFEPLYGYKALLQPLVKNILLGEDADINKIPETNRPLCYLFFEVDKKYAPKFFESVMIDKESILRACKEFITLFGVVTNSISPEAQEKADEMLKKLQQKIKTKSN
jgi:hypothetical protein